MCNTESSHCYCVVIIVTLSRKLVQNISRKGREGAKMQRLPVGHFPIEPTVMPDAI